jgi:hypothetical protein
MDTLPAVSLMERVVFLRRVPLFANLALRPGEMAILTQESRIVTLIAVGNVRVLTIVQKDFERILRERPETGLAVIRELCARLKESVTRIANSASGVSQLTGER